MENPHQPLSVFGLGIPAPDADLSEQGSSGIWELANGRLTQIVAVDRKQTIVLILSEQVLTLTVQLPPMSASRRREALPFAIEDRIAEPLSEVHVALGAEVGEGVFLAGVVRHELMQQWLEQLDKARLERASLVPDALALPVPGADSWSVDVTGNRAIVRAGDGTGFALPRALLEAAWRAAGEPACIDYGAPSPPLLHAAQTRLESEPVERRLLTPALDLRQGAYAAPRERINPLWKRVAAVTAVGLLAHGAIAAADTLALANIAAQRQAEVQSLAGSLQPRPAMGGDASAELTDMLPEGDAAPGPFLPLLWQTANALTGLDRPTSWRSIDFESNGRTLTIEFDTNQTAELQRLAAALNRAGLNAQPRPAGPGQATGSLVVRAP